MSRITVSYSFFHSRNRENNFLLFTDFVNLKFLLHKRLYGKGTYKHATITEHMPPRHQVYKHLQGHTGEDFKQLAARLGPNTQWAISRILISRIHEQQAYKSCLGVLRLAKNTEKRDSKLPVKAHWKKPNKRMRSLIRLGKDPGQAYAWSRTSQGGWATACSPILRTTITKSRLARKGLLSLVDYYLKVRTV